MNVHQGMFTNTRFAVMNGRSFGLSPSMTRSSTSNSPVSRRIYSLPMCVGRSSQAEAPRSASLRISAPRSIDTKVTTSAAATARMIANARRIARHGLRLRFGLDSGAGAPSLAAGGSFDDDGSRSLSVNDHQHAPGLDGGAGCNRD